MEMSVIIPMVSQIGEAIVLQRVELEEKTSSSHFWAFALFAVLMGKHGFAEKLQLRWNLQSSYGNDHGIGVWADQSRSHAV
jgi:hypothetical protein